MSAEETIITEEMRRAIGYETEPVTVEIDRTLITRFVEAVEDPSPLWQDEEHARRTPFGGIAAPPSLLCTVLMRGKSAWEPIASVLPPRVLDGGGEWEFFQPIHLGDTITVVGRLAEIGERKGRVGAMLLVISEHIWRNQHQQVVAKARSTAVFY